MMHRIRIKTKCSFCGSKKEVWPSVFAKNKDFFCNIKCASDYKKGIPIKQRLEKFTVKSDSGCWIWVGSKTKLGYGKLTVSNKTTLAHRASWACTYGEIPDGMCVLHKCDNPKCINPKHLFLGTYFDNTRDMISKGRKSPTHCEFSGVAKVNADQVSKIRERLLMGDVQSQIGIDFGLTQSAISRIKTKSNWSKLP